MPARQSAGPVLGLFCLPSVAFLVASAPSTAPPRLTKTTPQAAKALVSVHTSTCGAAICAASCAALPSRRLPGRPRSRTPRTLHGPESWGQESSWWQPGSGERRGVQQQRARRLGVLPPLCRPLASPSRRASLSHNHTNPVCRPRPHPSRPLEHGSGGRLAACVELARCYRGSSRYRPVASSPFRNPFARPCGGRGEPRALRWRSRSSCSRHPLSRSTCHPR